jgi:two-component sensor histidine kinase
MLLDEIAPFRRDDGGNIRFSGPRIRLNPRAALTLGLAIHELATNAAKHGALSTKQGSVEISWTLDSDNRLNIHWTEMGGPPVKPPSRSGFGRLLLERALASDLRGDVHLDFQQSGLTCAIAFPLDDDSSYLH